MARTYRRSGEHFEYRWVLRESVWVTDKNTSFRWLRETSVHPDSTEGRRRIARFHSDAETTMHKVPKPFRQSLNRRSRAAENRRLRTAIRDNSTLEDGVFLGIRPRNARGLWW